MKKFIGKLAIFTATAMLATNAMAYSINERGYDSVTGKVKVVGHCKGGYFTAFKEYNLWTVHLPGVGISSPKSSLDEAIRQICGE